MSLTILERLDLCPEAERVLDLVDAVEKHVSAHPVDVEMVSVAVGREERLFLEVDDDAGAWPFLDRREELARHLLWKDHRQEAVLEAIAVENVTEASGDDGTDAMVVKGIDRRLARRAAAEIAAR